MAKPQANYADVVQFVQRTRVTSIKALMREMRLPREVAEEFVVTMEKDNILTPKRSNGCRDLVKKSQRGTPAPEPIPMTATQLRKAARRTALSAAINPTSTAPQEEPQIPVAPVSVPQMAIVPSQSSQLFPDNQPQDNDADPFMSPRERAIAADITAEMVKKITGQGRMKLRDAVHHKIKSLCEGNYEFFTGGDVAASLLDSFKGCSGFDNILAFRGLQSQVIAALDAQVRDGKRMAASIPEAPRLIRTDARIRATLPYTPSTRTMNGYAWRSTLQVKAPVVAEVTAPVKPAAPPPVPSHVDIEPHPDGDANSEALQLQILTMNTPQCNACMSMLLSRMLELQKGMAETTKILLANLLHNLNG